MATRLYPIGIQTFEKIIEGGFVYVDKTEYVHQLANTSGSSFFLSRPRRFGKSLLLSTMKSYFEGKRQLFKGLAIERLETEWAEYPVLLFSMASAKHADKNQLERYLDNMLRRTEQKFGFTKESEDPNDRLSDLIHNVMRNTAERSWFSSMSTTRPCSTWSTRRSSCQSFAM